MKKAKPIILPSIEPSLAYEVAYRNKMQKLILAMATETGREIIVSYRASPLAHDASLDMYGIYINNLMRRMAKKWQGKFDDVADEWASQMARQQFRHFSRVFQANLIAAGWTIPYEPSKKSLLALNRSIKTNVELIRSIPAKYLDDMQVRVEKLVASGFDMQTLTESIIKDNLLKPSYKKAFNRASLIARDQSAKVKASIEQTEWLELGFRQAVWHHGVHADATVINGKVYKYDARPKHLKAGRAGLVYDIGVGLPIGDVEGEWVEPAEEINCKCSGRAILPERVSIANTKATSFSDISNIQTRTKPFKKYM